VHVNENGCEVKSLEFARYGFADWQPWSTDARHVVRWILHLRSDQCSLSSANHRRSLLCADKTG